MASSGGSNEFQSEEEEERKGKKRRTKRKLLEKKSGKYWKEKKRKEKRETDLPPLKPIAATPRADVVEIGSACLSAPQETDTYFSKRNWEEH